MKGRFWGIFGTAAAALAVLLFLACRGALPEDEGGVYGLLVAGEGDVTSQKIFQGASAAAQEWSAEVRLYMQGEDVGAQLAAMKQEDEIKGLIWFDEAQKNGGENIPKLCGQQGIKAVTLGRETGSGQLGSDETGAGVLMAETALEGGAKAAIFLVQRQDEAGKRQMDGAKSIWPADKPFLVVEYDQNVVPDSDWEQILQEEAAVLAFGSEATEAAVELKRDGLLDMELPLFGIGRPMEVESLESGAAAALLYPSYYMMGYRAMEMLHGIRTGDQEAEGEPVPYRMITLEHLYDSENVSYVFPLLN